MASTHLIDLRSQKTKLINSASSLAVRGLKTQEARDSYAAIEKQINEIDEDITLIEKIEARKNDPAYQPVKRTVANLPIEVARHLSLNTDGSEFTKEQKEERAFRRYLSGNITKENRDLLTTSDATGGAVIPQQYASVLVEARKHYGAILNYALVKYDSRPTKFEYFDDTANDIVLASEGNTFVNTGNDPVFGSVTPAALDLFKTLGVKASYELIDDSAFNVAAFLKRVALKRYFRGISRLLVTGHDASGNAAPNVTLAVVDVLTTAFSISAPNAIAASLLRS